MTLSKERLTSIAFAPSLEPCDYDGIFSPSDPGEIQAMASELLERRGRDGQEPVAYLFTGSKVELPQLSFPEELDAGQKENCQALYAAPPVPVVPDEMSPEMMRAVQLKSELGAYAAANLSGAYGLFDEFWKVACRAAMHGSTISNSADIAIDEVSHVTAPVVPDANYQQLSELYHAQEKRLFKIAQRIKGPSFDKYAYSPSQAIDVLEVAIFGESNDGSAAALNQTHVKKPASNGVQSFGNSEQLNSPVVPDGWIKCSERMPESKPGSYEYIVYETLNNRAHHDYFNVPDEGDNAFTPFWNHYGEYVTHWVPLPAAPKQESE